MRDAMDLTKCVDLQYVAVQGVKLEGLLALPPACHLHATSISPPRCINVREITVSTARLVTGLFLRPVLMPLVVCPYHWLVDGPGLGHRNPPTMQNLKEIRLFANKHDVGPEPKQEGELHVVFTSVRTPSLEVLDLDVQCNLGVGICPAIALKRLVLITAGTLRLHKSMSGRPPMTTLEQMYLHSGAAFPPASTTISNDHPERDLWGWLRLLDGFREEQVGWTVQKPAAFQSSNMQDCFCGACPECLARAGVPIMCDKAWTSNGFDKHLRPHCNEENLRPFLPLRDEQKKGDDHT